MGRKAKLSFKIKIDIVLRYLKGETTASHEAKCLGINHSRVSEWIALDQSLGEGGDNNFKKRKSLGQYKVSTDYIRVCPL